MRLKTIALSNITENKWNPNKMKPQLFESLKANIEKEGYLQPLIVRPIETGSEGGERYEIIDGAHRYRALKELGRREAQCVVLHLSESQAKRLTVAMNRVRGEFDYLELAEVLKGLQISQSEIEKYLAYSVREQAEIFSLLTLPQVSQLDKVAEQGSILIEFLLTLKEEKIVERALKIESERSGKARGAALVAICEEHISNSVREVRQVTG